MLHVGVSRRHSSCPSGVGHGDRACTGGAPRQLGGGGGVARRRRAGNWALKFIYFELVIDEGRKNPFELKI